MKNYLDLLQKVLKEGSDRIDRTSVGTRSIFGYQMRFDLQKGFPLVTTKKCHFHSIVHELLWFLRGETNVRSLQKNGVSIWNAWADESGELGPVYGKQWRRWRGADGEIDQIADLLKRLKDDPNSRRHIISAWNVGDLPQMALPPCHLLFQFYVQGDRLSCQLYQRSCDLFLGVPFNIASYALLLHLVAQQVELAVGEFIWTGGDIHIYHNHFDQVRLQLQRSPRSLPQLSVRKAASINAYEAGDILLSNYCPHPGIRAPIAV